MGTLPYINLGCGNKYHADWVNVDLNSHSPFVRPWDLTKGIPYDDNTFEVVYHSQVIEHYKREDAQRFIGECYRILRPDGIMRVVTPDLEDITRNYLHYLEENIRNPTDITRANYEWMVLELYDQAVRNAPGGEMENFFKQPSIINEQFVIDRLGAVAKSTRQHYLDMGRDGRAGAMKEFLRAVPSVTEKLYYGRKRFASLIRDTIIDLMLPRTEKRNLRIGRFRQSGDIHYRLYDRYSLAKLLSESGFRDIKTVKPSLSDIPDWDRYELDVKNGEVCDPTSLFIESRK